MPDIRKDMRKAARTAAAGNTNGDHEGALARAEKLAHADPRLAIVGIRPLSLLTTTLQLAWDLHYAAVIRSPKVVALGGKVARDAARETNAHHEGQAARPVVPSCVNIATALGEVFACPSISPRSDGRRKNPMKNREGKNDRIATYLAKTNMYFEHMALMASSWLLRMEYMKASSRAAC
ncbi:hypothetical protein E2562_000936 [Oryza meyeriana var. granulata]|uniref:Uncharacterized protein n=1 Tax=Oryza meyeriana var. granulata TaxID=110450 RepID=A0A6G1CYF5_9ORYZ|nr:hypothetical protein E2562_000936 [Oryza meyeriana var. granulata]